MSGKAAVIAMLLVAVLVGGGIYYAQVYAFFEPVEKEASAQIMLQPAGGGDLRPLLVEDMTSVQKSSSPLGYRACFTVKNSLAMMTETYALAEKPTPLEAPRWFSCFDADKIGEALEAGTALAFEGKHEVQDGVDEVIAVFPDGEGYAWHQLNDKSKDGDPLGGATGKNDG